MTAKTADYQATGENVSYAVVDGELVIKVKLDYRNDVGNPKTVRIATTSGNKELAPGVFVGINAYEYRNKK
jgi:hypothetical protein